MTRIALLARRYGFDVLIVLAAIHGAVSVALDTDVSDGRWFASAAVALVVLVLLGRRRFPFAAPAALWLLAAGYSFVDGYVIASLSSPYVAGLAAALLLGNLRDAGQARVGLAIVLSGAAIIVYNKPERTSAEYLFVPAIFAIAWLAGFALRSRAAQAEAAEQRAINAEREREASARIAVAEERARIARELHDVVAHAVSVMVLQVGAVRHQLPAALEEDKAALTRVEQAGRTALAEMRRLLGAMRSEGDGAELAPQPGLDSLDSLVGEVGRAGLPVRLQIDGDRVPLPRALDLSAYRIVQEGLTNALKHARASEARVTVHYGREELRIEVRDNGAGRARTDGMGHGLIGVRERVKIYGGQMSAGAAATGGFVLSTSLPLRQEIR